MDDATRPDALSMGETVLITHEELTHMLQEALAAFGVPGAAIGVASPSADGTLRLDTAVRGVINQGTGYPVIDGTLFQIGSLTKIWTTVLAMQLVDEGRLSLDTRVKDVLPDFRVIGSPDTTYHCTVRDLMCHVSGIEGDAFPDDLGRGDDCVARYVDYIGRFPARTPLRGPLSYSNGAFVILGRIIEVLRGMSWDEALQTYIVRPSGFGHVWTLPEDILRFSAAIGHQRAIPIDEPMFPAPVRPASSWHLPRCTGPCGQISASIGDVMGFASLFLREGVAPNGTRILSRSGIEAMLTKQVDLTRQGIENIGWALGWQIPNWGTEPAFGHGGATIGQRASIVVFPKRKIIIAVLTNADAGTQMASHLIQSIAGKAGIGPRPSANISDQRIDESAITDILGVYERLGEHMVFRRGGTTGVEAVIDPDDDDGPNGVQLVLPLYPTTQGFYAIKRPDSREPTEMAFLQADDGRHYVAVGHRVTPRIA